MPDKAVIGARMNKPGGLVKKTKLETMADIFLFILFGVLIVFFSPTIFSNTVSIQSDASVFYSVFSQINKGLRLYTDLFDHKDPAFYYLYSVFYHFFNFKGPMIWDTLISWLDVALIICFFRKTNLEFIEKAVLLFIFCAFNWLPQAYSPVHTYHQAILFFLLTLVLIINSNKFMTLLAGIACILMVFTRFTLIVFVPLFLIMLFLKDIKRIKSRVAYFITGAFMCGLSLLFFLAVRGELTGYIDAFLLNLHMPSVYPFIMSENNIVFPSLWEHITSLYKTLTIYFLLVLTILNIFFFIRNLIKNWNIFLQTKNPPQIEKPGFFYKFRAFITSDAIQKNPLVLITSITAIYLFFGVWFILNVASFWPHYYQTMSLVILFALTSVLLWIRNEHKLNKAKLVSRTASILSVLLFSLSGVFSLYHPLGINLENLFSKSENLDEEMYNLISERYGIDDDIRFGLLSQTIDSWLLAAVPDNFHFKCRLFYQFPFFSNKIIEDYEVCLANSHLDVIFVAPYSISMNDSYNSAIQKMLSSEYRYVSNYNQFEVWQNNHFDQ